MKHIKELTELELPTISGMVKMQKKPASILKSATGSSSDDKNTHSEIERMLDRNTGHVTEIRNRLGTRKEKFFYLTFPGIVRIAQVLASALNISCFAFYCTYYEDLFKTVIPPFFVANSREQYFLLVNYYSILGASTIIMSGIAHPKSHAALMASLFPTLFDFIQFLSVMAASISVFMFYKRGGNREVIPGASGTKFGIVFIGGLLALFHFIECIFNVQTFFRSLDYVETERIPIDEEGNLRENTVKIMSPRHTATGLRSNV